jgi:hypothetical protein
MQNKLIDFIGDRVIYDQHGQKIFGVKGKNQNLQLLLDLRGWGAIQHLTDVDDPGKFQDDLGQWFVDAINEKLEHERNKSDYYHGNV